MTPQIKSFKSKYSQKEIEYLSKYYKSRKLDILLLVTFLATLLVFLQSCRKFIKVEAPATSINASNVFTNDATAAAVLTGIYSQMSSLNTDLGSSGGITGISLFAGLCADELTLYNTNDAKYYPHYFNDIKSSNSSALFWNNIYSILLIVNSAIEGLNNSTELTPAIKGQLLGEAKFIRGFCYFYLVNLYGDVPLSLNTDYKLNSFLIRSSKDKIYDQVIDDLKEAQNLLSDRYLMPDALSAYGSGSEQRVRPSKWAAISLLARVYLYIGDYVNAETEASLILGNATLFSLSSLTNVFKANSIETIWALQPVYTGTQANTGDGAIFILPDTGPNANDNPVYLSNNIVRSFEPNDLRKINWVDSVMPANIPYYYANKYKIGKVTSTTKEYVMVMRLAEQYLIRAEARAQKGNIFDAQADLNVIRNRAGLSNTAADDKNSLLVAIMKERKVELFTEWGHRWLDLKRTNTIDTVMNIVTSQKGGSWSSYKALFPIPQYEIDKNINLRQNDGY